MVRPKIASGAAQAIERRKNFLRGLAISSPLESGAPPPLEEHAGLRAYHKAGSKSEVHLASDERAIIGRTLRDYLNKEGYKVLAVAVTAMHAHILVELPHDLTIVKKIMGEAKRFASQAIEDAVPGSIWSASGKYKPVIDRDHARMVHGYIINDQGATAWTWSFRDASRDGTPQPREKYDSPLDA